MLPATVEKRTKTGVFSPAALEQVGARDVGERLVVLEVAVGAVAARVDDPLGDALVVEVEDLLAEVEVFQQRRAAGADPQRVLVVGDRDALLRGQYRRIAARRLVGLTALPRSDGSVRLAGSRACVVLPLDHVRHPYPCWNFCCDGWTEVGSRGANVIPGRTTEDERCPRPRRLVAAGHDPRGD